MKYYYQSNTEIYTLSIGGDFYQSRVTGKATKQGVNVLKNAFPPPTEINAEAVPMTVKLKFEKKIATFSTSYSYVAESASQDGETMKIEKRKKEILEIREPVRIVQEGRTIILEKGDRIEVLHESVMTVGPQTIADVAGVIYNAKRFSAAQKVYNQFRGPALTKHLVMLNYQSYGEKYREPGDYADVGEEMAQHYTKPTNKFAQAVNSLNCYLYQIEGSISDHPTIKALEEIKGSISQILGEYDDSKNLYWGD